MLTVCRGSRSIRIGRVAVEADGEFDLRGNLISGDDHGLSPNDVLFMAWCKQRPISWSRARCAEEWVRMGNAAPAARLR